MKTAIVLLASVPFIAAHGKIAVMTGDAGGNGTAIGIQGAVIPGAGRNKVTEPDTTVFAGRAADECGKTNGGGVNDADAGTKQAMALSGDTLPQVTAGGSVTGTLHVVTTDGFGPFSAKVNEDGTMGTWKDASVTQQVPGTRGNGKKTQARSVWARAVEFVQHDIMRRATNVNEDYPIAVQLPADMKCTGNLGGQPNTCLVRITNPSNAGPFGGCVPVQQVAPGAAAPAPAAPAAPARRRKFRG